MCPRFKGRGNQLRALGNAVVPQVAELVGRRFVAAVMEAEAMEAEALELTGRLVAEAGNPHVTREMISGTYAAAMDSGHAVDWKAVNAAILDRWSRSGLMFVKREAAKKGGGRDGAE